MSLVQNFIVVDRNLCETAIIGALGLKDAAEVFLLKRYGDEGVFLSERECTLVGSAIFVTSALAPGGVEYDLLVINPTVVANSTVQE